MRTIKRYSLPLNKGKWDTIIRIADLYRDEKNLHLIDYNQDKKFISDKSHLDQQMRNVRGKYVSPNGLQARQWKIIQKDAYQTVDKSWCALAAEIRGLIGQHKKQWSEAETHYAYWLAQTGKRMASLMVGLAPVPAHFQLAYQERKRVRNYLRRVIRRNRGNRPLARLSRSIHLDADMYTLVENMGSCGKKVQFLKVMGLESGKRMVIPLTGFSTFSGNIRLVLDFVKQRVEVHTINELVQSEPLNGEPIALDVGITEVFTDDAGVAYEPTFGKVLTTASDQLNRTGKSRNKAHTLRKKSGKHKAQRIRKYNLGKNKMRERKRKGQIRVQQMISQAIRAVARTKKPNTIITERLDIRGKAKSKRMSRIVSYWMRSALKERLEFLALVECFHHKQVNPAYSSQMCPTCLFVDKGNRAGDKFKCLNCGHTEHADRVAAKNLLARANDPDITIYTPKSVVRSILQGRFIASLQRQSESAIVAAPSVSGRTGAYENAA